jgi:hypothetical protein
VQAEFRAGTEQFGVQHDPVLIPQCFSNPTCVAQVGDGEEFAYGYILRQTQDDRVPMPEEAISFLARIWCFRGLNGSRPRLLYEEQPAHVCVREAHSGDGGDPHEAGDEGDKPEIATRVGGPACRDGERSR